MSDFRIWPWTWKHERDVARAAYHECHSIHGIVSSVLNNSLTLLYCVAVVLAIWKLRGHLDWRP